MFQKQQVLRGETLQKLECVSHLNHLVAFAGLEFLAGCQREDNFLSFGWFPAL